MSSIKRRKNVTKQPIYILLFTTCVSISTDHSEIAKHINRNIPLKWWHSTVLVPLLLSMSGFRRLHWQFMSLVSGAHILGALGQSKLIFRWWALIVSPERAKLCFRLKFKIFFWNICPENYLDLVSDWKRAELYVSDRGGLSFVNKVFGFGCNLK